ncbi:SCAN domain-containing protein 3-like [Palaemon carinicauda]|uniref:SCAN domain-containing protein 3-like n=1 Tax=Palaemon carinicauda TaxID=392227 RepID=UPI0035B59F81
MSHDIKDQVIAAIKKSGHFSLQLDESTDVSDDAQLMTYVRYQGPEDMEEEFLFCRPLQTRTTGKNLFMKVVPSFKEEGLLWRQCYSVCCDGAPVMLGARQGFIARVKQENPSVVVVHCLLHQNTLNYSWVRNPLHIEAEDLPDEIANISKLQEELIEIQNDATSHYDFKRLKESLSSFWIKVHKEKPNLGGEALKTLIPFATTFLCEAGFSALTVIKTKYRNHLQPEDDLRCILSTKSPRFEELTKTIQCQESH